MSKNLLGEKQPGRPSSGGQHSPEASTESSFQERFDAVADGLGLELAAEEAWPPWGLVMVAVQGAGDPDDLLREEYEEQIEKAIRIYEAVDPFLDGPAIEQLQSVTTDPFFCVEDETTYSIEHGSLAEMRRVMAERMEARQYQRSDAPIDVRFDGIFFAGPVVATVNFTSQQGDLAFLSSAIMRREEGEWLINVVTHFEITAEEVLSDELSFRA